MRITLFVFFVTMLISMISCANQTDENVEIQCPGGAEGEFITVTVPMPQADEDGWIHPDELLRHDAALLFFRDMEDLGCPTSRMENRELIVEMNMELLKEAEEICNLTYAEITHRIDSEVEQRRAAAHVKEDSQFWELPLRQDLLVTAVQYSAEYCPWYEK